MALLYAGQGTYVGGTIHYAQYQEKSDKLRHGGSAAFVRDSIAGCHREHCQGGHNCNYGSVFTEDGFPSASSGTGWTYDDTTKTLTINADYVLSQPEDVPICASVVNNGTIADGLFFGFITNNGTISGGCINSMASVNNNAAITGGTIDCHTSCNGGTISRDIYFGRQYSKRNCNQRRNFQQC